MKITQWEYVELHSKEEMITAGLNGWECYHHEYYGLSGDYYYMKRPCGEIEFLSAVTRMK